METHFQKESATVTRRNHMHESIDMTPNLHIYFRAKPKEGNKLGKEDPIELDFLGKPQPGEQP